MLNIIPLALYMAGYVESVNCCCSTRLVAPTKKPFKREKRHNAVIDITAALNKTSKKHSSIYNHTRSYSYMATDSLTLMHHIKKQFSSKSPPPPRTRRCPMLIFFPSGTLFWTSLLNGPLLSAVKEFYGTQYQSGFLILNFMWGVVFTACVFFFFIMRCHSNPPVTNAHSFLQSQVPHRHHWQ